MPVSRLVIRARSLLSSFLLSYLTLKPDCMLNYLWTPRTAAHVLPRIWCLSSFYGHIAYVFLLFSPVWLLFIFTSFPVISSSSLLLFQPFPNRQLLLILSLLISPHLLISSAASPLSIHNSQFIIHPSSRPEKVSGQLSTSSIERIDSRQIELFVLVSVLGVGPNNQLKCIAN